MRSKKYEFIFANLAWDTEMGTEKLSSLEFEMFNARTRSPN